MSRSQDASSLAYDVKVKEQDRWLPIANVARVMGGALPDNAKVAKEAKECMQECVTEFISFITSEAAEKCSKERRKTVGGEDILSAMTVLGFENYAEALKVCLGERRLHLAGVTDRSITDSEEALPSTGHDRDGSMVTAKHFHVGVTGQEGQAVERNVEPYRNKEDAGTAAGTIVNTLISEWTTVAANAA